MSEMFGGAHVLVRTYIGPPAPKRAGGSGLSSALSSWRCTSWRAWSTIAQSCEVRGGEGFCDGGVTVTEVEVGVLIVQRTAKRSRGSMKEMGRREAADSGKLDAEHDAVSGQLGSAKGVARQRQGGCR